MRRLAIVLLALAAAAPANAVAGGRYIGMGDSVAGGTNSYVDRFGQWLTDNRGITDVQKIAMGGETSSSILGSQLNRALDLINDPTDTQVVSVDIGGNDAQNGICRGGQVNDPSCPYADNLASLLRQLNAALANDPGDESVLVMGYYGTMNLPGVTPADVEIWLRGSDAKVDTSAHGKAWGMSDVAGWVACRYGGTFVDAFQPFNDNGGQALMADGTHPNAEGQALLAGLFQDPSRGGPAPTCPETAPFVTHIPWTGGPDLRGIVEPRLADATWWVEYGPTTSYGSATAPQTVTAAAGARAVSRVVPADACHARFVVESPRGRSVSDDSLLRFDCPTPAAPAPAPAPPDTVAPALRLSGKHVQRVGPSVVLSAQCPTEACTVAARGRLVAGRTYGLGSVTSALRQGVRTKLTIKLSSATRAAARARLAKHRSARVDIRLRARDAAGNATAKSWSVTLKR